MARVRLASWYGGHAPGDVVEVPDELLRPLTRDGRVAEVLPAEPQSDPAPQQEAAAAPPKQVAESPLRRSRKGGDG